MVTKNIPDYYRVLKVSKSATPEQLKQAYIRLAKTKHPDRGGSVAAMQRINQAYGVLRDPERRVVYDRMRTQSRKPISREEEDDLFVDELFYEKVMKRSAGGANARLWFAKTFTTIQGALKRTD